MVARDHDRANAGRMTLLDRVFGFLARRIDHADQARKRQIRIRRIRSRRCRMIAICQRQHAECAGSHLRIPFHDQVTASIRERFELAAAPLGNALRQDHLRRTFGMHDRCAL